MQLVHILIPLLVFLFYSFVSKMFLTIVGVCVLLYMLFYLICTLVFDCDVALGFAEIFGKPISSMKGKIVYITGASSGIGEHTAVALAKQGVRLVLTARRKEELERVKTACLAAAGNKLSSDDILVQVVDATDAAASVLAWDEAVTKFGRVDVLVCNAGRSQRAHWELIQPAVDQELFTLNVFAPVNLARHAVRYFLKEKMEGHVAVTSSIAGVIGAPFSGSYTGSKHAIHGYFNCLRAEKIMDNITVSLICPGPTFTNFLQHSFTEVQGQKYGQSTNPSDRRMTGERCGHLCAVALANKLDEVWMGLLPLMPLIYIAIYCPVLYKTALKIIGPQKLLKLRDSKEEFEAVGTNTPSQ